MILSKLIAKLRLFFLKIFGNKAELDTLKKELEQVKKENEDYKQTIESYKAELDTLKKELEQVKKENEDYKQTIESYKAELDTLKKELEQVKKENEDYKQTIQILNTYSNNKPISIDVDNKIKSLYDFVYKKLIPELDRMNLFNDEYEYFKKIERACETVINNEKKPWLKDRVVVAFVGKYSAGKSSIINTILGSKLLPVNVTPTTAVPTFISFPFQNFIKKSYQSNLIIYGVDNDHIIKEIPVDIFKNISHDKLKSFPFALFFKYIIINYKHNILKKITILDTPGYDSLNKKDRERTMEAINESDVIMWILDIEDGTLRSDAIEFIKETIHEKRFYVIINKADLKSPKERNRVLDQIQKDLARKNIRYEKCLLYSIKENQYKKILENDLLSLYKNNNQNFIEYINKVFDDTFNKNLANRNDIKKFEENRKKLQSLYQEFRQICFE